MLFATSKPLPAPVVVAQLEQPDPIGGYDEVLRLQNGATLYLLDGDFHRTDGPSFIGGDGTLTWHRNGAEHRTDGPAVEYPDGAAEYWVMGVRLSEELFKLI